MDPWAEPPKVRRVRPRRPSQRPWLKFVVAAVLTPVIVLAVDVAEFTPHAASQSFTVGVSPENFSFSRHFTLPQAFVTANWTVLPQGDLASLWVVCTRGAAGSFTPDEENLIAGSGTFTFRAGVGLYQVQVGDVNEEKGASVELTLSYTADAADTGF